MEVKVSAPIEHEKRKQEILDKALDVFVEEGYEDTTFQKIAERCGITRTILYLYFKNKKEIFSSSIKRFMGKIEESIQLVAMDPAKSSSEKLVNIGEMVVQLCEKESKLLSIILDYLLRLKTSGVDPDERVRRRTIRMRHIITTIVIEGKKKGDFSTNLSVKATSELFYALIEAVVFRITVLGRKGGSGVTEIARLFAHSLDGK
jgi:AcrR family transcriptional regulator